jgi:hypothetical protein
MKVREAENALSRLKSLKANDIFIVMIAHGSQISLMSGGSSMYGSATEEQRQANEVRRLKRELSEAREQVMSLSSQLSTNVSTRISSSKNNSPDIDFVVVMFSSNEELISNDCVLSFSNHPNSSVCKLNE